MAISLDVIKRIPVYQRGLILLGIMVLIGVGYYFGVYAGKKTVLVKHEKELAARKLELDKLRGQKKDKAAFEAELAILNAKLAKLEKAIPTSKDIPEILLYVSNSAEKYLDFRLFKPGKPTKNKNKNYTEVPIKIQVVGDYNSFVKFLDLVRQFDRIIVIRNISITGKKSAKLNISCTAITFIFPKREAPGTKDVKKK